ncbi:MAG: glycosyltransferase [Deltaproteobacteria bacterium]|nr:glycosyltransferase [Deltaproteobacteria bacterium]
MEGSIHRSRPIRVLRIITRLNIGGVSRNEVVLTEGLREQGFETLFVSGRLSEGEVGMYDWAAERVGNLVVIPELAREVDPASDAVALARLIALVRSFRPDVIHTNMSKAGLLGRLAGMAAGATFGVLPGGRHGGRHGGRDGGDGRHQRRGPVLVHTYHGHVFSGYFGRLKSGAFLQVERFLARSSSVLVALSQSQKTDLSQRYRVAPQDRFRVIPLGFEHLDALWEARASGRLRGGLREELFGGPRAQLALGALGATEKGATQLGAGQGAQLGEGWQGVGADAFVLGTVGRLVPIKNHALLLEAFSLALRQAEQGVGGFGSDRSHRPMHLVIVGDGGLRAELEARAARPDLAGRVHFIGWRSDLDRIYSDLDLFVLSSNNEGTPVAVIEALAAGVPVLSTAVGGVADVLEQGRFGRLVEPGDARALARAMCDMMNASTPDPAEISHLIRARYAARRLVADMAALYRELLDQ